MEMPKFESFDRTVRTDRGVGRIVGRAFTQPARFYVEYDDREYDLFTSAFEIEAASPEMRAWVEGLIAGSTPDPPENDEAREVWSEERRRFEATGRPWRFRSTTDFDSVQGVDRPEGELLLNHHQLAPAAADFLSSGQTLHGWSGVASFVSDSEALTYGVSANKEAFEIWHSTFNESNPQPISFSIDHGLFTEWGAWAALQDFLSNYPAWENVERVIRDIESFGEVEIADVLDKPWADFEVLDNPWWNCVFAYSLVETDI